MRRGDSVSDKIAGEVERQDPFFAQLEQNTQTTKAHAERGLDQVRAAREVQQSTPGCAIA